MRTTEIHPLINKIIQLYYRVGLWYQGDVATRRELNVKLFYTIYMLLFVLSLAIGAILHENQNKSIYLAECACLASVSFCKFYILIWKQRKIEQMLNRVCVFTVRDEENFAIFTQRLSALTNFGNAFLFGSILCIFCEFAVYPFLGSKKTLALEIAFPLNWRKDEVSFWIANLFVLAANMSVFAAISFAVIITYLLMVCSLRYRLLGSDIKEMGERATKNILKREKQRIYFRDLIVSIKEHLNIRQ